MVEKNSNSARQTAEMIAVILTLNEDENREALVSFLYDKLGLELGYGARHNLESRPVARDIIESSDHQLPIGEWLVMEMDDRGEVIAHESGLLDVATVPRMDIANSIGRL